MKRVLGAIALAVALVSPVSAAAPGRFTDGTLAWEQIDRNVEPYTGVWNPTQCGWDTDDHIFALPGTGYLDAGQTSTAIGCFIAVEDPVRGFSGGFSIHPNFHVAVTTTAPIVVTMCYPAQGWCAPPGLDRCVAGPTYQAYDPAVVEIPGSNGGWGVPSTVVITFTNPTGHRVRDITAFIEGGNDQQVCSRPGTYVTGNGWWMTWY